MTILRRSLPVWAMRSAGMRLFRQRKRNWPQEQAAKDAENKRAQEEKNVKKQTFMQALERIENLEYQEMDAQDLVSDAIDKLSLVTGDEEETSLSARLQAAISRITTLPTESEWNAAQAEKEAEEARKKARLKCRYNPSSVSCAPL